ncbi:uncharacterized protein N7483_000671 [Penicillium malachiteum]|uniref:uncharacterized protein n=1 Tax=Penicillium malachiteum TaxID=1324776 RepID=UPI0025485420|nr:uncharacterized protein N7483_000671 [Penicillium malachiteum]KAJ5735546.1 hypothetical protein N7483_000671 [Penicillium malachiteum]
MPLTHIGSYTRAPPSVISTPQPKLDYHVEKLCCILAAQFDAIGRFEVGLPGEVEVMGPLNDKSFINVEEYFAEYGMVTVRYQRFWQDPGLEESFSPLSKVSLSVIFVHNIEDEDW